MAAAVEKSAQNPPKIGRPTKYKPEYDEKVIEFGAQGMSLKSMAWKLNIGWPHFCEWQVKFPTFGNAVSRARELAQGWWEDKGRLGIDDRNFNSSAYSLQVRNRFPQEWRDKQDLEVTGAGGGPIQLEAMSVEQIRAELAKRGAIQAQVVTNETPQEPAKICQSNGSLVVETGAIEAEIVGENATSAVKH